MNKLAPSTDTAIALQGNPVRKEWQGRRVCLERLDSLDACSSTATGVRVGAAESRFWAQRRRIGERRCFRQEAPDFDLRIEAGADAPIDLQHRALVHGDRRVALFTANASAGLQIIFLQRRRPGEAGLRPKRLLDAQPFVPLGHPLGACKGTHLELPGMPADCQVRDRHILGFARAGRHDRAEGGTASRLASRVCSTS